MPDAGLVLHDALERTRAPLVEVQPARQRLDAHLQVLHFDAEPRDLDRQVVHQLVAERFRSSMPTAAASACVLTFDWMCSACVILSGLKNSFRIGLQQLPQLAQHAAVRLVERRVLELVVRRRRADDALRPELLDEVGPHAARIEELLELDVASCWSSASV